MEPNREELLIHRVVEGAAEPSDWSELELLARADSGVWERLADAIRIEGALRNAVDDAVAAADAVELPLSSTPHGKAPLAVSSWLGWAAAVVIAALWIGTGSAPESSIDDRSGSDVAHADSQAAFEQYCTLGLEEGRVIGVLPSTVMKTRPGSDGRSIEVLYVRRTLERTVVDEMYELNQDESGLLKSVPVSADELVSTGPH